MPGADDVKATVRIDAQVPKTPRVLQVAGMMDVPVDEKLSRQWEVELPLEGRDWNVGMIGGASGSGKTTLARYFWPESFTSSEWTDAPLVDNFPPGMPMREIQQALMAAGLGSVPSWLLPYRVLSGGEQFRADVARLLAEPPTSKVAVIDEYTSTVDRHVAQVASHALQKAIRREGRQVVAVSCHDDLIDWLQPDWVLDAVTGEFAWRSVHRHPPVQLEVSACSRGLWPLFRDHHYLSGRLHTTSKCFAGYVDGRPVVFAADIYFPHPKVKDIMMGHRIVVLPDWQGLGIAGKFTDWQGAYWHERGFRYRAGGAHPALVSYQARSPRWRMVSRPPKTLGTGKAYRPVRGGLAAHNLETRRLGVYMFEYVPPERKP